MQGGEARSLMRSFVGGWRLLKRQGGEEVQEEGHMLELKSFIQMLRNKNLFVNKRNLGQVRNHTDREHSSVREGKKLFIRLLRRSAKCHELNLGGRGEGRMGGWYGGRLGGWEGASYLI